MTTRLDVHRLDSAFRPACGTVGRRRLQPLAGPGAARKGSHNPRQVLSYQQELNMRRMHQPSCGFIFIQGVRQLRTACLVTAQWQRRQTSVKSRKGSGVRARRRLALPQPLKVPHMNHLKQRLEHRQHSNTCQDVGVRSVHVHVRTGGIIIIIIIIMVRASLELVAHVTARTRSLSQLVLPPLPHTQTLPHRHRHSRQQHTPPDNQRNTPTHGSALSTGQSSSPAAATCRRPRGCMQPMAPSRL
jgi:hypothetical protein